MEQQYTSLTLNGKTWPKEHLQRMVAAYNSEIAVAGWEKNLYDFIGEWLSDASTVEVQTSGSTGEPRIMHVGKEKMIASAQRTGEFLDLKKGDKAVLCLPLSFIAGKMMVVRAFVLGLDLVTVKPSSNPLADFDQPLDFAALTPMQVFYALQSSGGKSKISRIRKLIIGGGEISSEMLHKIQSLKNKVWHTYGMAETLTHVAMKKLNGQKPDRFFHALPGIKFHTDHRGCLVIDAPWLSVHPVATNDLVDLINDTSFDFTGRIDNVINSGGIKISAETLESKLASFFSQRFVIVGLPDPTLGRKVVLVLEGRKRSEEEVQEKIEKAGLTGHEKPREIHFMYHFPQTESGKVIRKQIIDHLSGQ